MALPDKPGLDPIGVSRWQGEVDNTLKSLDGRMGDVEETLDDMPEQIEKRITNLLNGRNGKGEVTFKWVLEKIMLPVLTGGASAGAAIYAAMRFFEGGA